MRTPLEVLISLLQEQGGIIASYTIAMVLTFAVLRWLPRARARTDQKIWTNELKIDLIFGILVTPIVFVGSTSSKSGGSLHSPTPFHGSNATSRPRLDCRLRFRSSW